MTEYNWPSIPEQVSGVIESPEGAAGWVIHAPPPPNWECCFGGDWHAMTIRQYWASPPNAFQRGMQRFFLGIWWRRIR